MSMTSDLRTRLLSVAAIAAAVEGRIARFERPRGLNNAPEFPAVRLTLQSPGRGYSHEGPVGLDRARVQIDVWAESAAAAEPLFVLIRNEMETPASVNAGATRFHTAQLTSGGDTEPEDLADQKRVYRIRADFEFYHEGL